MWHEGSAHCSTAAFGAALGVLIMRHTRLCPGDSRDRWLPLLTLPATAATAHTATAASAAGSKQVEAALSLKLPQKFFLLFCTFKNGFCYALSVAATLACNSVWHFQIRLARQNFNAPTRSSIRRSAHVAGKGDLARCPSESVAVQFPARADATAQHQQH